LLKLLKQSRRQLGLRLSSMGFGFAPSALQSTKALQGLDAHPNRFVCMAHDLTLLEVPPFLNDQPERDIKDWQEQGFNAKIYWVWLYELPRQGGAGRAPGQCTCGALATMASGGLHKAAQIHQELSITPFERITALRRVLPSSAGTRPSKASVSRQVGQAVHREPFLLGFYLPTQSQNNTYFSINAPDDAMWEDLIVKIRQSLLFGNVARVAVCTTSRPTVFLSCNKGKAPQTLFAMH
jgi:hypothetical protein